MKRYNGLFDDMICVDNINRVYNQIRCNVKNKFKVYRFDQFYTLNVSNIRNLLMGDYVVGRYNIFLIRDPKYRIVMSQGMYDKLINHLVGNVLISILDSSLIDTNVATRKGKGVHYGLRCFKRYLNELKGNDVFVLKFDLSKYFYSIDHNILKKLYYRKIKDKRFLSILDKIVDSTNESYINDKIRILIENEIERVDDYKKVNELRKIPFYEFGKGLPIGNLTSQILAVFYLNYLDHYITEKLKVRYVRYMDDGILLSNDKDYLVFCMEKINEIMCDFKLKLNSKTCIVNVSKNGVCFLGFVFFIRYNKVIVKVKGRVKRNFFHKVKLVRCGKVSYFGLASYKGHFKYGNCYSLFMKGINGL